MRTWNIVALVLTIAFAFSSVSYAQGEKEKSGWQTAKDVAKKGVEVGGKVSGKMTEGQSFSEAVDSTTKEEIPVYAFLSSHQGFIQITFGKCWGGKVFLCAFILLLIVLATRDGNNRGLMFWFIVVPLCYVALRGMVFGVEYMDGDGPKIMGFISIATILVEIAISHKFFRALPVAFSDDGFKGVVEVCKTDFSNPSPPDEEPTTDDDSEFSVCTNPSCGKKMVLEGRCGNCGHMVQESEEPDAPAVDSTATTSTTSTTAGSTTTRPTPKIRTREERLAEVKKLLR